MRPHPVLTGAIILTLLVGILLSMSFLSQEEGTGEYHQRGVLTLIITGIIIVFLLLLATSKMWFPHLWKKNSNHDRHKQHSPYHPAVRDRQYHKKR